MNKYELALVVSANVDEEVRNATVEQVKVSAVQLLTRVHAKRRSLHTKSRR